MASSYAFNPFGGYLGANSSTPFASVNREDAMARALLSQDSPGMTSAPGAIGNAIKMAMAGYLMGKSGEDLKARQQGEADTISRALQAGQGGGSTFDPATNQWTDNAKADPTLMAKVLSSNPDTAAMGLQNATQQITADAALKRQEELQNRGFDQQRQMQEGSQSFQERMAKSNQAFQRSMGTPIAVVDSTSPTGFKYVRPEEAVGKPAFNDKALFGIPGMTQNPANPTAAPATGDDFLKTLPPAMAQTVKGLAEGRIPVSPMMVRTPQGMQMLAAASQYDPTFDATNYQARAAQRKNYQGGGKQYQELQAISTVAGHLKDFKEASEALNNSKYPMLNSVENYFSQAAGDPRVDKFNTVRQAVTNELSKAYRGGMVTEGDVKEWQQNISSSKSPDQLRAVIGQLNDLLMSKRQALEEGYKSTMGKVQLPSEFSSVNERTKGIFDNIAKWAHGETSGATPASVASSGASGGWSIKKVSE